MSPKTCSTCKVTFNIVEEYFHKSKLGYFSKKCKTCANHSNKIYREANRESIAARKLLYSIKHKAKLNETSRVWDIVNYDRKLQNSKNWAKSNPDLRCSYKAKRRSAKLNAVPKWVNQDELDAIACLYTEARRLEDIYGEAFHVDHEIPLINSLVCGFHCFSNLRVITAKENLIKGNKFTPYVESDLDTTINLNSGN